MDVDQGVCNGGEQADLAVLLVIIVQVLGILFS